MPRLKVHPLNRRRVAQACDVCKRRKEKCDGLAPCGHCKARRKEDGCHYSQHSTTKKPARTEPFLRENIYSNENGDHDIDHFLDRSMDEDSRAASPRQTDTTLMTSAPVPKLSRMMRNGEGKFSMAHIPPWTVKAITDYYDSIYWRVCFTVISTDYKTGRDNFNWSMRLYH